MASTLKQVAIKPVALALGDHAGEKLARACSRSFASQITAEVTDEFLELLLAAMKLVFFVSRDYRKNIEGFRATYVVRTKKEGVAVSAVFAGGKLRVLEDAATEWDTRVTFTDDAAVRRFLFSKEHDVLDSLLRNEVAVEGNLNLLYKFGFLALDLRRRFGV